MSQYSEQQYSKTIGFKYNPNEGGVKVTLNQSKDYRQRHEEQKLQQPNEDCIFCPSDTSCFETDSLSSSVSQHHHHNRIVVTNNTVKRNSIDYSAIHPTYQHHLHQPIPDIFPYASLQRVTHSNNSHNQPGSVINDLQHHVVMNNSLVLGPESNQNKSTNNSNNIPSNKTSNLNDTAFICESFGKHSELLFHILALLVF
jgi:hypothetical protein